MNNEMQDKLVEILSSIQTATGKAADFAIEQLPDVAQSYVMYGRISITFWLIASLAAIFGSWKLIRFSRKLLDEDAWSAGGTYGVVFGVAGMFIFPIMAVANLNAAILVWVAPKVWLLKEIAGMLK